jgi:acylphosphatase
MAVEAKLIVVHGDVQGVGFRYFVQRVANRLGITGNVRNCPDSTVEIIAQAESDRMADFIREVQRGPRLARVDRLEIEEIPPRGNHAAFLIEGW